MMKNLITNTSIRGAQLLLTALMAVALTACGGGNGSGGTPIGGTGSGSGGSGSSGSGSGSTSTNGSISVKLASNNSSCPANTITASCQLTATAKVADSSGNAVANQLVTFTNSLGLAVLAPSSGTTLTDSNGNATVTLGVAGLPTAADNGTAGTLTASASVGGKTVTDAKNFSIGTTAISLSIVKPASNSAAAPTAVNAYGSVLIEVEVQSAGAVYTAQPVTVTFQSNCSSGASPKATLTSSATTVNGIAAATYTDNGCGSTDTVVASVAGATPVSIYLNVATPVIGSINFVGANPSDSSIVFSGTGGSTRTSSAILTFKVVDSSGTGVPGKLVTFTDNSSPLVTMSPSSNTSGPDGTVTTTLTAVSQTMVAGVATPAAGTLAVTATTSVDSTNNVSAISNQVIVSTGIPTQLSFTIAPTKWNIEGLELANNKDPIVVLIADADGNPVVDGTPIIATTNEGQIGSSSSTQAGCTTINGACTLIFTTQNPTCVMVSGVCTQIGQASITFTSTDGVNTISDTEVLVMSGNSFTAFVSTGAQTYQYLPNGGTYVATDCSGVIGLYLTDEVGNPLSAGTTIAIAPFQSAATTGAAFGTVFPATIPSIAIGSLTAGSSVSGSVTMPSSPPGVSLPSTFNDYINPIQVVVPVTTFPSGAACNAAASTTTTMPFTVQTKTPSGLVVQQTFNYQYPH